MYDSARPGGGRGGGNRGGSRSGSAWGGGGGGGGLSSARRYGSTTRTGGGRPQKYDKNKFLQANFRFLVSDALDMAAYEADAEKMLDWDDVLQVEMASAVAVQCLISLDSPPLCPQITPCGHVLKFAAHKHRTPGPYMFHRMRHMGVHSVRATPTTSAKCCWGPSVTQGELGPRESRRSAPCPLCFSPVVARELRLVRIRSVAPPRPGQQLTMTLIRRTRTSIIPQPVAAPTQEAAAQGQGLGAETAGAGCSGRESGDGGGGAKATLFVKFVVVGGGCTSELWRAAAEQLAGCANQLLAEGGLDAAHEAPFVYGALEQLAAGEEVGGAPRGGAGGARAAGGQGGAGSGAGRVGAGGGGGGQKMFTTAVTGGHEPAAAAEHQRRHQHPQQQQQQPTKPAKEFPSLAPLATSLTPASPSGSSRNGATGPMKQPLPPQQQQQQAVKPPACGPGSGAKGAIAAAAGVW
ncbi:hypothetical protein CHLRE_16g681251v5 [Chlamydomonas reinhardtii]|uniref:Uncharacterized protein n=1 Tax=Chlamydomonas reinhardtii TaxID=3055 RepID=A0A2K3CV22_CHLRE|nr:uncharacterized protein CHLRE_16g681251v5 [Chlamydomonas reinhardtii]PNW72132.1 hypothetical protein CHLRE_16g681251v5 [Chlamydomonas reinhardtii]